MEINLIDVFKVLENVINGSMSREDADRWAFAMKCESDNNSLTFVPAQDRQKIWSGVMFLYGIDSKESPTEYLHPSEDIEDFYNDLLRKSE